MWSLPVVTGRVGSSRWKMLDESAQDLRTAGGGLFADLVAGAPEHDRRMVAIAVHEVGDVALGPLGEVLGGSPRGPCRRSTRRRLRP